MTRPAHHGRSARAWWRGAVAVAALAGYLVAWGGTAAGQGWRLAPHLALGHTHAPPALVAETPHSDVLTTLRPMSEGSPVERAHAYSHTHDRGQPHTHEGAHRHHPGHGRDIAPGSDSSAAQHLPPLTVRPEPPPAAGAPDVHRHGDVVHSHAPPPPRDDVPAVSLDKHQLPAGARVPPLPSADAVPLGSPDGGPPLVDLSVETPPPIARG